MTAQVGLFVARDSGGNGTTPKGARQALAGLLMKNADGTVRTGVLADGLGPVVAGTAGMSYSIRKHVAVAKASEANGPTLVPNDGFVTVATTPAPGSNSRIDVIYVLQNLVTGDGGSEVTNTPIIDVVQGATSATPSKPPIPAGALELASVPVTAGTTATSGLTFTPGQWTVANGAALPAPDGRVDTGWLAPASFGTGWASTREGVYRRAAGHVTVALIVTKASWVTNDVMFTLPEGFRPAEDFHAVGQSAAASRYWVVRSSGQVMTVGSGVNGILGSVTFPVG